MKNFSVILNVVLVLLVGYLYFLHFSNSSTSKKTIQATHEQNSVQSSGTKVAYLDLDSLQSNYGYYKKIKAEFERKQQASNDEIVAMQKRYQTRAMQLQQKGTAMSPQDQEAAMQEINKMQQSLQERKQVLDNELYGYNTKMKEDILNRIQNFLKDYNKDQRYDYIFSYEPGFMFYKDSSLNITPDVIQGLNALYEKNKN
ncbi:MAG: OmpH family outer membrane protein [Chitinophagaceae bacterium]|nr:OmpH family outer membrane protein [Chitinophagaceae bacterium]